MPRTIQSLALADINQTFLDAESKIDEAIQRRQFKRKSVWRSMIPRGTYMLGEGLEKKVYRFHAGMGPQRGLQDWHPIQISRKPSAGDPGYDSAKLNPHSVNYGFDSTTYNGFGIEYATDTINIRDIRFMWQLRQQLTAVYSYLGDFTNEVWENYHREMYLYWANQETHIYLMTDGQLNSRTGAYDPFSTDSDGDNVMTIAGSDADIGTLDWSYLRWLNRRLEIQAPMHNIGEKNGRPVFGWVGDIDAVEKMIKNDAQIREDWRHHKSSVLIDNFGETGEYDNYALTHDIFEPRFTVKSHSGSVTTLKRVDPYTESAADLLGSRRDVNDDYLNAEFGLIVIMLKDVFTTEITPEGPQAPGAGTVFGAQPGYNGKWSWINNKDNSTNPLGHLGYWLMMCEAFSKPGEGREEAVAILYRRYTHTVAQVTGIGEPNTAAEQDVTVNAVTADVDTTNNTVTLTLAGYLSAEAGAEIVATDDDAVTYSGIIGDSSAAPTYMLALESAPSAFGKWTAAGGCKVTVS